MDTTVPEDKGAGVGESGVVTPYETGNLGKGDGDWSCRPRGATSPDDMNENRRNKAGTGQAWAHPWEGPSMELGKLGSEKQKTSTPE